MKLQAKDIHSDAYIVAVTLIAVSIPLSKFAMSLGEFTLLGLWLLSGFRFSVVRRFFKYKNFFTATYLFLEYLLRLIYTNLFEKTGFFLKNRAAVVLASVWFLHVVGLINTSDFQYAFKDLRVKLPLLLFPVIFATIPKVNYNTFRKIMLFYTAAVFTGTLISFFLFLKENYYDIREISPFISSIRFGLNIAFAFFILLYFVFKDSYFNKKIKLLFLATAAWFITFLVIMESITALSAIIIIILGILIHLVFISRHYYLKIGFTALLVFIPAFTYFYVKNIVYEATTPPKLNPDNLDKYTSQGNPYIFDTVPPMIEDGKYVGIYICYKEMKEAWNKRSKYDFDGKGKNGNSIKTTLIRYLTSKNLRKDADGVNALTRRDVELIENGVANYNYIENPGLHTRILKVIKGYESYKATGNPSGSSIMQRLEYLKASLNLIKQNFWTGVGVGDLEKSFFSELDIMNSKLSDRYKFHAHNQYLAIFIILGIFGFLYFLFALIYPVVITNAYKDYFFTVFYSLMLISMFSDDTFETQAGATLFGFFTAFLMLGKQRKNA